MRTYIYISSYFLVKSTIFPSKITQQLPALEALDGAMWRHGGNKKQRTGASPLEAPSLKDFPMDSMENHHF